MTELKTLKELADEHGFPFEAVDIKDRRFHCVASAPDGRMLGWYLGRSLEGLASIEASHEILWTFAKKQRTAVEILYSEESGRLFDEWIHGSESDAEAFCARQGYSLIKILRTEVIEK